MKKLIKQYKHKAAAALLLCGANAAYALPEVVTSGVEVIGDEISALEALVWPFIIAVTVALLIMKLFKRFSSKI